MTQNNPITILASSVEIVTFRSMCGYLPIYLNGKPAIVSTTDNRILLDVDEGVTIPKESDSTWTLYNVKQGSSWGLTDSAPDEIEGFCLVTDLPECLWQTYELYLGAKK